MQNNLSGPAPVTGDGAAPQRSGRTGLLATGGFLAALGVSSCCVLPVLLMSAGLGGAWLGNLYALSAYQPAFIGLSVAFLGAGFYSIYRPANCRENRPACAQRGATRVVRGLMWLSAVLVILGIMFPYLGRYLLNL